MRRLVKRARGRAAQKLHRIFRTRGVLASMLSSDDARVAALGTAIARTLADEATPEERGWLERIRGLRSELAADVSPLDGSTVGRICEGDSRPHPWLFLLFNLVREQKPERSIELGTCIGLSAAYQGAALALNGCGSLVTLEMSEARVALAQRNLAGLGLEDLSVVAGKFQDTLDDVLRGEQKLDFAYIDGHHDEIATQRYYEQILPYLSEGALIAFDDIRWSDGMERAWARLSVHPSLRITVDLFNLGLGVRGREDEPRQSYRLALD